MKTTSPLFRLPGGAQMIAAVLPLIGLLGATPAAIAAEARASELMEKGVYSEETKGDLDAAMQLYRQVIAEADAGQALGAQAQFRLAICYEKKKDLPAATAAFEKLIRDYPNQKELTAVANEHLASGVALLPVPWVDGEDMRFNVNLQSGFKAGVAHFTVAADEIDGRKIWRLQSHLSAGGVQQWGRVEVDAGSFKPIRARFKHTLIGEANTHYTIGGADVKLQSANSAKHIELSGPIYDNEQAIQLMRRLPLSAGANSTFKVFSALSGGTGIPLQLTVEAAPSVVVPAGTFDCMKVALNIGQTYWYSTDTHHYLVKFETGSAIVELASVKQRSSAESERYDDPNHEFSVTLPAGWMADRKEELNEAKRTEIVLLDPEDLGATVAKVEKLGDVEAAARASVRAYAEYKISGAKKYAKEFAVRADSWTDTTVAGKPAVSFVADVVKGKIKQVVCGVYAFVDGNAVDISTSTAPDDFEAFRPQFTGVVASFQSKRDETKEESGGKGVRR